MTQVDQTQNAAPRAHAFAWDTDKAVALILVAALVYLVAMRAAFATVSVRMGV